MKKISRILIVFLIFAMVLGFFNTSRAVTWDVALNMVREAMDTKYYNSDKGYVTHKITSIDSKAGEVKLRMTLTNLAEEKVEEEVATEIYIILSETLVTNPENYERYCDYIETLANKIFAKSSKAKIGIIGMRGPVSELIDEDGDGVAERGEGDQGRIDGTENDSEVVLSATNNMTDLRYALANMNSEKKNYYVNLQSALITAEKAFEDKSNKVLISLFDDVPSTSVGTHDTISYTTESEVPGLVEERYTQLVENTRREFLNLEDKGIEYILLRPDDRSWDRPWYSYETGSLILNFDGSSYVRSLYGTLDAPTYGKMYSLEKTSLEKIVTDYIYTDIVDIIGEKITSVQVVKYFTQEILDNFSATIDDVDGSVDTSNISKRYWIWNVKELAPREEAVLNYTLRIKNMDDVEKILDLILSVDEKVDIKYTDDSGIPRTETEPSSPQIKLSGKKIEDTKKETPKSPEEPKKVEDNTKSPAIIPYAGEKIFLTIFIGATVIIAFIAYVKYKKLDDVK